jgi:phosphatidylethanolamine-binding protein (PEBP) family uncharacterized protein
MLIMFHPELLLAFASLTSAIAYPNVLPKYQQEIIHQPGTESNDKLHFQSTIRDILLANQIIPQVLDDFEPIYYIDVSYPKHHDRVLLGNDINPKHVSKRPTFTFHPIAGPPSYDDPDEEKLTFTLILTDPDALSREKPVKSEMCHWIITNLTGTVGETEVDWPTFDHYIEDTDTDEYADDFFVDLDTLLEAEELEPLKKKDKKKPGEVEYYYPPAPPKKTGPHRYVFVLLEGGVLNLVPPKERPHWGYDKERHGIRDWAAQNNLTVVGANFFFAQNKKQ